MNFGKSELKSIPLPPPVIHKILRQINSLKKSNYPDNKIFQKILLDKISTKIILTLEADLSANFLFNIIVYLFDNLKKAPKVKK